MKYYHCYGYSEINDVQREVDILIKHEDINYARLIASRYITNISHFDEYPINIKDFGPGCFTIKHEGLPITIISSLNTIREGFQLLIDLEMEIIGVDSLVHPLKPYLQQIILGLLRRDFGISNDDPFTTSIEVDEPVDGSELTPTQLIKITELITQILRDAKELYVKTKGIIGGESMALFTKTIEMLQQTLAQGDIITAKEQTKKLISLMEQVEGEFMEYEKARDHQIQRQITIPNLNNILAHNQWMSAHKLYETQTLEHNKIEQRYETIYQLIFKKRVLYLKGIASEIRSITGPQHGIIRFLIKKLEYMLVFMSIFTVGILEGGGHIRYRSGVLFTIALAGLALQLTHSINFSNTYYKLGFSLIIIIIISLLGYQLASNLALI